jgi:hypothetical protein
LAGEFARRFFEQFLGRTSAGEAMVRTRLQLLTQNNPLGLVYSLYAAADLRLKATGPGVQT